MKIEIPNELIAEQLSDYIVKLSMEKMDQLISSKKTTDSVNVSVRMVGNVQETTQAWIAKQDAIKYFGYENHKPVFQKLLKRFKEDKRFKKYYLLPTHKVPIVRIDKFEEFLRIEEVERLKK